MLIQSVFNHHQSIPSKYTCDGKNISPPLDFLNVPEESTSLVLIVDDPDAPVGTVDHWILWNLPPQLKQLTEEAKELKNLGAVEGLNYSKKTYYHGPCPPHGQSHRYYFKLYALNVSLSLPEGSSKQEVEQAMKGHVIKQTELIGIYQR